MVKIKYRQYSQAVGREDFFNLAPDGKRVAVVTPVPAGEAPKPDHEVVLLLNFFDKLRRCVPVGDK